MKKKLSRTFPIVGIGASAGGLEALELFLGHARPQAGLAYIVVQHLDPTQKDFLSELLQRVTTIPVVQITDRLKVEPDRVYIIPPNRDLSIFHGVLHLLEPSEPRGRRLPIDSFFLSLAEDQKENSVAVILSGMGSDGTVGLHAIKEHSGAVFVQTPQTAKYDSMPKSAQDSGLADEVGLAEELAEKIIAYEQRRQTMPTIAVSELSPDDRTDLDKVILVLRSRTKHDFSFYKKSTLYRRIERRMGLHQCKRIAAYVNLLRENPQEVDLLFKELLIGVTTFFRDPPVWEQLKSEVLPALLAEYPEGGEFRAWVAGCSTGEEAYSLAIVFKETLEEKKTAGPYSLQIFATDLEQDSIAKARTGEFGPNIEADVSKERLKRYFVPTDSGFHVTKDIREMVTFAPQNLILDPPFTKLDLLTCRNLLIYLEASLQKKLISLFHYTLKRGGVLLLGGAETAGTATDLFVALPGKTRLYRRKETELHLEPHGFPISLSVAPVVRRGNKPPASNIPNLQQVTDALLLGKYSPAAVLTTNQGDIVYISGRTGQYLEPAVGKANLNLFAMAREGLSGALYEAFSKAVRQKTVITMKGLTLEGQSGSIVIDLTVEPQPDSGPIRGMVLVVFQNRNSAPIANRPKKGQPATASENQASPLVQDLRQAREDLQNTREEMQTSQEELKSTNEELQSTNEELQSTNEELTSSKEEMQSMNEELMTVNQELQSKLSELSRISDDMKNLLNSTDIATLFLDQDLKVRSFTNQTTKIIKLIPRDIGRPITDLVTELDYPGLAEDAREVLRSLVFQEKQITASGDRWFTVRIMPYRTQDNRIDGVVITFVDVTGVKASEASVREALTVMQRRFTDQTVELDAVKALEIVLQKAQTVLEKRLTLRPAEGTSHEPR